MGPVDVLVHDVGTAAAPPGIVELFRQGFPLLPSDAKLVPNMGNVGAEGEDLVGQGRCPAPPLEQDLVQALAQPISLLHPSEKKSFLPSRC
jgi:hypothetical protein